MSERLIQTLLPILIVDDDIEITKAVARDLRRNAQVIACNHPAEALEKLSEQEFSVIVSDLKMPIMNGIDLLEKAATLQPHCQRILLTAFVDLANIPDTINRAQINFLMTKPWEPDDLRSIVERAQRLNELERENRELRRMALVDALTGVSNNRYFWERLDSEFSRARRYGRPLSLIMSDIDNFKKFNDEHGHLYGDQVLHKVAQGLEQGKRGADTVARYGGEEFAIILPEVTRPKAIEIATRHLQSIIQNTGISLSLGVATYPDDAASTTELVDTADRALLKAKNTGKGRVLSALDL
ncbi:MAG: diguanylate cyclase [Bdellovibrionota bacterium]